MVKNPKETNLFNKRLSIFREAAKVDIDFEVTRMDYLSSTELDSNDDSVIDTDWSNRMDAEVIVIDDESNLSEQEFNRF